MTAPKYTTYIDDNGQVRKVYHEALQADELNQLLIAKNEGGNAWARFKRHLINKGKNRGGRYKARTYDQKRRKAREDYYGRNYPRGY